MKRFTGHIVVLLVFLAGCTTEARRLRMHATLDSINALNRSSQPFNVQDVEPLVTFFDRHGTPDERLMAHYLLGRALHEHGEAPAALQCYHDAIDCVDTTDCDFAQLSRVYGQMGGIFSLQGLYHQEITYYRRSEEYAWKGKDTLAALMYYEQLGNAYKNIGILDSTICIMEKVAKQYAQYEYASESAIALGSIIRTLVKKKEYAKAKSYMEIYESKSGLFDSAGNIAKGREYYYRMKGEYFLAKHILDSAELYFRKEMHTGLDFNNQNAAACGLAELYRILKKPDSTAKYAMYAYSMNDSIFIHAASETIERMQSMYDYSRYQNKAFQEEQKATNRIRLIWICFFIIILVCIVSYILYKNVNNKRHEIELKYLHSLEIIRQAQKDIEKLNAANKTDNLNLIKEKQELIQRGKEVLRKLPLETFLYKKFFVKGNEPTTEEWKEIENQVFSLYPSFSQLMVDFGSLLNDKEHKTCVLIRIGFKPKIISNMLNVGPSYISNIRADMLKKIFGQEGSPKDFDYMIRNLN